MYDSGITVAELITAIKDEADISISIPDSVWVRAINTVEQFIYSEILREYRSHKVSPSDDMTFPLIDIPRKTDEDAVQFDDIVKVFADDVEVTRSSVIGATEFPEKDLYYSDYNGKIVFNLAGYADEITIIYKIRPMLKAANSGMSVAVPAEFIDMVAAKMRGEAYKIANEDGLAAKWLADYNAQLESFKIWATSRNDRYGG